MALDSPSRSFLTENAVCANPASVQESLTVAHLCADGRESIGETTGFRPAKLSGVPAVAGYSLEDRPKENGRPERRPL